MNAAPISAPLIDATALQDHLGDPDWVLIDVSFDLADLQAGRRAHADGHIPGAHFLDIEADLSGARHDASGAFRGRHPLPARADLARRIGALCIGTDTRVVAYDRQGGMFAARLWWLLRWLGHAQVSVLDGGFPAWQRLGGAEQPGAVAVKQPGPPYPERAPLVNTIEADTLQTQLAETVIVDARAPERYRGEVEPLDAAAGHIPGALNHFFKNNLADDGRFLPPDVLRQLFSVLLNDADPATAVHQCGSGVTACHNLLASAVAGLPLGRLYPGSWSEWSADPTRPVAKG